MIRVVDFVAVHLDDVVETVVPDPDRPTKTITIQLLVGTIVRKYSTSRAPKVIGGLQSHSSVVAVRLVD